MVAENSQKPGKIEIRQLSHRFYIAGLMDGLEQCHRLSVKHL